MTPRCAALQSAVERAEESLRHTEERARQAVERARLELLTLQRQLERETARDPTASPTFARHLAVGDEVVAAALGLPALAKKKAGARCPGLELSADVSGQRCGFGLMYRLCLWLA